MWLVGVGIYYLAGREKLSGVIRTRERQCGGSCRGSKNPHPVSGTGPSSPGVLFHPNANQLNCLLFRIHFRNVKFELNGEPGNCHDRGGRFWLVQISDRKLAQTDEACENMKGGIKGTSRSEAAGARIWRRPQNSGRLNVPPKAKRAARGRNLHGYLCSPSRRPHSRLKFPSFFLGCLPVTISNSTCIPGWKFCRNGSKAWFIPVGPSWRILAMGLRDLFFIRPRRGPWEQG